MSGVKGRNAQNSYAPPIQIDLLFPRLGQNLSLYLAQPYVPIRNAETILIFRKLLKFHLFDLALPP